MKITKLYREIDGKLKSCNCQDDQLDSMLKSGWENAPDAKSEAKAEEEMIKQSEAEVKAKTEAEAKAKAEANKKQK